MENCTTCTTRRRARLQWNSGSLGVLKKSRRFYMPVTVSRLLGTWPRNALWPASVNGSFGGMVKDVQDMITHCDTCQKMNRKMTITRPELHPIPVKSSSYHVGVDFIGFLPLSSSHNQYILTLSDYCTKWVEAVPAPNKCPSTVADILFKIFMRMGLPQVLTTDQGSEFVNQLSDELMKKLGIDHRLTTPYHPRANGLDERWNQTLQNMLVKFAEEKKELWDSYLDMCVFFYNTSQHESTHFTPFELMFGRKAVLSIDVEKMRNNTAEDAP